MWSLFTPYKPIQLLTHLRVTRAHTHAHTHTHTHTHTLTHTHTHTPHICHILTHTLAVIHSFMHIHTLAVIMFMISHTYAPPIMNACHTNRMLGRDELCSSARQCLEILTRAEACLKSPSLALDTVSRTLSIFQKFLSDLDNLDRKQGSDIVDDGINRSPIYYCADRIAITIIYYQ